MKNSSKLFSLLAAGSLVALPVLLAQTPPPPPPPPPAPASTGAAMAPTGGRGQLPPATNWSQADLDTLNAALRKLLASDPAVAAVLAAHADYPLIRNAPAAFGPGAGAAGSGGRRGATGGGGTGRRGGAGSGGAPAPAGTN